MNNIVKLSAFIVIYANSLFSAEWSYTGYYPWVWDHDNGEWYYVSSTPMVWSNEDGEYILNPLMTSPFDVNEEISQPNREIVMHDGDTEFGVFQFNFSGIEYGNFSMNSKVYRADYDYVVNPRFGTILFYITLWDAETYYDTIALSLEFSSSGFGYYKALGNLGRSSCQTCTFSGTFMLQQME